MPRRKKKLLKRQVEKDPRFGSVRIARFTNVIMERGKKNVARKIINKALDMLIDKAGSEEKGVELFNKAFKMVTPIVEVKARRVGGSVYQIPREIRADRAEALAMRWIKTAAAARSNKTMWQRLGSELLDAAAERGSAFKKKLDVHRMAEANRAFSHYSW